MPVYGLFLMITRKLHLAAILSGFAAFILFYIDQYIFAIRLTHIRVSDLQLIDQALRVAGRYYLTWNPEITRRLVIFAALMAFLVFVYRYYRLVYRKKALFFTGLGIFAAMTIVILSGVIPEGDTEDFDFAADTESRGLIYSWYCQLHAGSLEAPENYSDEAAKEILSQYVPTENTDDVRVIVIMNESLADYSLLGIPCFEDPLPYIHSLVESGEAFEGKLAVSVFGGGTSNTEFEFLTGCSTAFLPDGCTPYLQYVDHSMENMVRELGEKSKIAVHPYYSEEWNRTQVYRFFGFDRFISGIDFGSKVEVKGKTATSRPSENIVSFGEGPLYVRGLISDRSCYERIQEENADFTFAVTMQNHGPYDYTGNDFANMAYVTENDRREWTVRHNLVGMLYNVDADNIGDELYKVNQYLTLANLSDQAFEDLIEEIKAL